MYTHSSLIEAYWLVYVHRWARLQKTNESLLFPFSVCSKQTGVAVFHIFILKRRHICRYIFKYVYLYIYIYIFLKICEYLYIYICWKMEAQAIFPNRFPVCSLCKRKFVVCPICLRKNKWKLSVGLNWLNRVAHLCLYQTVCGPSIQCRRATFAMTAFRWQWNERQVWLVEASDIRSHFLVMDSCKEARLV